MWHRRSPRHCGRHSRTCRIARCGARKRRPRLRRDRQPGRILYEQRCIPASILTAAAAADIVRDGSFRSAWFAHRGGDGTRHSRRDPRPRLQRLLEGRDQDAVPVRPGREGGCRLAVTEAPIDALSLAAIDGRRADTLYVATGGGIGPGTVSALRTQSGSSPRSGRRSLRPRTRTGPGIATPNVSAKLPPRPASPSNACGRSVRLTGTTC